MCSRINARHLAMDFPVHETIPSVSRRRHSRGRCSLAFHIVLARTCVGIACTSLNHKNSDNVVNMNLSPRINGSRAHSCAPAQPSPLPKEKNEKIQVSKRRQKISKKSKKHPQATVLHPRAVFVFVFPVFTAQSRRGGRSRSPYLRSRQSPWHPRSKTAWRTRATPG